MKEFWFVTWRHINVNPLGAMVQGFDSKEEAEQKQQEWLTRHAENHCYECRGLADNPPQDIFKGDNDLIVTRVRTEKAVYRTLGFK